MQISARQFRDGGDGGHFQRNSAAKLANEFCMHVVDLYTIATAFDPTIL